MKEVNVTISDSEYLYNKYDNTKLNHELGKFIYKCAKTIPLKDKIIINCRCTFKVDKEENIKIINTIHDNFVISKCEKKESLKKDRMTTILLLLIGIVFIILSYLINQLNEIVIEEILTILGWVVIWESAYYFFFIDTKQKHDIKKYIQLSKSTINIIEE